MHLQEKTTVKRIEWFSNESEMILNCEIVNGSLKYPANIAIPGSCLNRVLSDLQKQKPDFDLNDCMKIEQWSKDETSFVFDFSTTEELNLYLIEASVEDNFKQIRA